MNLGVKFLFFWFILLSGNLVAQESNYNLAQKNFTEIKDITSENQDSIIILYQEIVDLLNFNSTKEEEIKLIIDVSDKLTSIGKTKIALSYLTRLNERNNLAQANKEDLYSILGYAFKNLEAYNLSNQYLQNP